VLSLCARCFIAELLIWKRRFNSDKYLKIVGTRQVDFLVDSFISVELKAITKLEDVHFAHATNYLEA
jgi:hypothetical protein